MAADGVEITPSTAILWAIYTDLYGFAARGALLESGQLSNVYFLNKLRHISLEIYGVINSTLFCISKNIRSYKFYIVLYIKYTNIWKTKMQISKIHIIIFHILLLKNDMTLKKYEAQKVFSDSNSLPEGAK